MLKSNCSKFLMEYWGDLNSLLIHLIWLIWTLFFSFQCDCDHAWRHQAYPATAEAHLQKAERLKLAWRDNKDKITKALISTGDTVGDMHQLNMLLLPWVICPHGGFGPQLKHFLFHKWPHAYLAFTGIPNTERMYRNINQHRSPSGRLSIANHMWGQQSLGNFSAHPYTAPTPLIHTLRWVGLSISKEFAKFLTNASTCIYSPHRPVIHPPPILSVLRHWFLPFWSLGIF